MRKKLICSLVGAALIMSLSLSAVAAPGFIGSVFNSNNGVGVSQKEDKKPAIKTNNGEKKHLTAISTEKKEDNSLKISGANAAGNSLSVKGATKNEDGTVVLGGGGQITTQEQRESIIKKAETTVMVTQSAVVDEMLKNFTEKEADTNTTAKQAVEKLVENGVSVLDAVKTTAISNTVKGSASVSDALDKLSEEIKPQVQEAAKKKAAEFQETAREKTAVLQKALEIAKELVQTVTEKVDSKVVISAIAAEDKEKAAQLEKTFAKLEQKNVEITPEIIEKVIEKQEERQEVLKDIEEGNVDQMKIHSVIDISVSDDVKEMTAGEEDYVEISVDMPGVDEDTLAVAIKPVQDEKIGLEDEELFQDMQENMDAANAKDFFKKLGNRFSVINCTTYDGGITLEMPNFSPVMILTYADTTTDIVETVEEETTEPEAPAEETVAEAEEPAAESGSSMLLPAVVVLAIVVVAGVVVFNKKKSNGTEKK